MPTAEFALNSRVHSSTGRAPFELIYGYIPEFQVSAKPTGVPAADDRLRLLREAREDAKAALELTAERMKHFYDHGVSVAPVFKPGDKVYVECERHPKGQPSSKLAPRRDGPYPVLEKLGDLNYRLKLSPKDTRHPVFHVDRLRPAKTASLVPDRTLPEPPPVIIDEEEEYEVEAVLDSRIFRRQFQYLIKWKGYSDAENSWEPVANVANAKQLVEQFHKTHPGAPRPIAASLFLAINFWSINDTFNQPPVGTLQCVPEWENGRNGNFCDYAFRRKGL